MAVKNSSEAKIRKKLFFFLIWLDKLKKCSIVNSISRSGEMADTLDSKSGALAGVWVQVPPSVPLKMITPSDSGGVFLFLCCSCYGEIRNLENLMILKSGVKKRSVKFRKLHNFMALFVLLYAVVI